MVVEDQMLQLRPYTKLIAKFDPKGGTTYLCLFLKANLKPRHYKKAPLSDHQSRQPQHNLLSSQNTLLSMAARVLHCRLPQLKSLTPPATNANARMLPRTDSDKSLSGGNGNGKIVLQPRLATLRSYGTSSGVLIKTGKDAGDISEQPVSPFIEKLFDYIDTTKKTHDFEIISGRLAMIVFAGTVTTELLTGSSIFQKLDTQGIDEAALVAIAAVGFAAVFAWVSIARQRVAGLLDFTSSAFIDSVVDQIVHGMFDEA